MKDTINSIIHNLNESIQINESASSNLKAEIDTSTSMMRQFHDKLQKSSNLVNNDSYYKDALGYINKAIYALNSITFKENESIDSEMASEPLEDDEFNECNEYDEIEDEDVLNEDTVKNSDGTWSNKGKEGSHGKFKTKKEADAQRKAMFANGYKS